jgi:hypothetical protein
MGVGAVDWAYRWVGQLKKSVKARVKPIIHKRVAVCAISVVCISEEVMEKEQ